MKTRSGGEDPRRDGRFVLTRAVPSSMAAALRHQRGFNKWISPWIVAIADPRASIRHTWPAGVDPTAEGCASCTRPEHLRGRDAASGVFEIWTNGRLLAVRPDASTFEAGGYAYLASSDRLTTRISTVMADTVRKPDVRVAAQSPAIAGGMLQETTYLNSGEIETSNVDLVAGGRADWDVFFDRTYRSGTLGGTAFGEGWESSMLRRLRELPNGDVEYRDGGGDVWLFRIDKTSGFFERPRGLFLKLARNDRGFVLVDSKQRITAFDALGRLIYETDEFATTPYAPEDGNVIRYLYDEAGRLAQVIDPVGRASTLTYDEVTGRLESIRDWRGRVVDYGHDAEGRLLTAALPQVSGMRPTMTYGYETAAASSYLDALELRTNLKTITDPIGGAARVIFGYGSGADRDRAVTQQWATGETATFSYTPAGASVVDAMGQRRNYVLSTNRQHVAEVDEVDVETSTLPFGELPASLSAGSVPRANATRSFRITHDVEGLVNTATLLGVRTTTQTWKPLEPGLPGFVLETRTTAPATAGSARGVTTHASLAITQTFTYEGAHLRSFQANELPAVNVAFVHGRRRSDAATNDAITRRVEVDAFGRPTKTSGSGGTDATSEGSEILLRYEADGGPPHARGLVTTIVSGDLTTKIAYPNANTVVTTDARNIETTTELDEWLRAKRTFTSTAGLGFDESTSYDANGRVRETTHRQSDRTITQSFEYDDLGRLKRATTDNVAVGESLSTIESTVDYELGARKVTRTLPGGAVVTELLDGLGRIKTRTTNTGDGEIREELAYDLGGNVVYAADDHVAQAFAYDAQSRNTATLHSDGTKTITQYDDLGQPTLIQTIDATGIVVSETNPTFTSAGRLTSIETRVDATQTRKTETKWDGAGRSTLVATEGRASHARFHRDGRVAESTAGEGSLAGVTTAFQRYVPNAHDGPLVTGASVAEKGSPAFTTGYGYDALGNAIHEQIGTLGWQQQFDEAGNLTSHQPPSRPETTFAYDGRGNVTHENKPNAVTIRHGYAATGAAESHRDPVDEVTSTTTDRLGRPRTRTYADGTSETWTYDGSRLQSMKDREGRTHVYGYNAGGQLADLRNQGGELLEKYEYDEAGRVTKWTTRDAQLVFENFDMEGRPRRTRQIRYANRSGFAGATVLSEHVMEHEWNVHGERTAWTMPLPAGFTSPGWTQRVEEEHDAMGNVEAIRRSLTGSPALTPFMAADFRNEGRPNVRTLTTSTGAPIVRTYGYDAATAQLDDLTVTARGLVVAGSAVSFDGVQIAKTTLHGVSAETRANEYQYDELSRLATSRAARISGSTDLTVEHLTKADFREALERTSTGPDPLPSLSFERQTGHKIAAVMRDGESRAFSYGGGAERIDDGRFVYEFDARGRLITATEKSPNAPRRIHYDYAASNRVVGRRAEYKPAADWILEDRAAILTSDALPAAVTFVWDPISDTLVTVAALNGEPLRQILQGGNGYDDPIEVAIAEAGTVHRLYPVFDEAGAGTLQVILNQSGEVVSRTVQEGAYGEDEFGLAGAAIDRIALSATKNESGALQSVTVTIRATEPLDTATVVTGARLAAVDTNGAVVRSATTTPTLFENYTLRWTLTSEEWTALTASTGDARSLSIAVTDTLRASAWSSNNGILPAPDWATSRGSMFTSSTLPVEYRAPLADLSTWLSASSDEKLLFESSALSALGGGSTPAARFIVAAGFQALPFAEPATGLIYVRNRWYDPSTGTFLTPDPMGYADSSNLYSFAKGDPVNNSDPTGELCERANASSWWDWTKRCSQDVGWFAEAANENITHPKNAWKNTKRAAGGAVSTGKLVGGAVRTVFWDLPTASVNDAAADRLVAGGQAIGNFVSHPIDTTISAHERMAANVLRHEQKGEYVASGEAAASQAQTDFLVAYSAYTLGSGAVSRLTPSVTLEPGAYTASWFADNPLLAAESSSLAAPVAATSTAPFLYHYTRTSVASLIEERGVLLGGDGNVYLTPRGDLSPLQAQIDLALPPNRGLPGALFEVDVAAWQRLGVRVPMPRQTVRMFNMPGGGQEVVVPEVVPPSVLRRVR